MVFTWKSLHLSARRVEHYRHSKTEFLTSFAKIFHDFCCHITRGFSLCRNWVYHTEYDVVMNELPDRLPQG